jgi:PEGA domain
MGVRAVSCLVTLLGASVFLTVVSAQERGAPAGAVVVRPVQVREVRVNQPAPPPLHDQRPTFGLPRPVDPAFISRPIPRPQPQLGVTSPRRSNRIRGRGFSSFKPRFNLGHGVVVGYPVIYPYAYPYDPFSPSVSSAYSVAPPSPNTYSNVDSLPASSSIVTPASPLSAAISCEASAPCGGVSFDITPASAQVYVDGTFAGLVEDFDAASEPLLLAPGTHYVEIRLAGFRTATFDVTITPGEITPYQGALERLRLRTP